MEVPAAESCGRRLVSFASRVGRCASGLVISAEDARRLVAEGYECLACGREIAPEKAIVFVDERRLERVGSRRPIRVDLGPAFLTADAVALIRFDETDVRSCRSRQRAPP